MSAPQEIADTLSDPDAQVTHGELLDAIYRALSPNWTRPTTDAIALAILKALQPDVEPADPVEGYCSNVTRDEDDADNRNSGYGRHW